MQRLVQLRGASRNAMKRAGLLSTNTGLMTMRLQGFAAAATSQTSQLDHLRNIGISAHIDSGKTTLTERILFYTGRINAIHEVRGKDGVGATMDSMELERERGITIQSAATFASWGDYNINIIDTPGHVDFTVEVERALRVLDGAVLVLCAVGGVQSQTITVDRQMKRYNVPRVIFVNKMDRNIGADPWRVIDDACSKLHLNAAALQVPIGVGAKHEGVVDLVTMETVLFQGEHGNDIVRSKDIPADLKELVDEKREIMIERLAEVDDEVGELFLMEEEIPEDVMKAAIRRQTIARTFVPVFMGAAYKNKGVQALLDGVIDYLPAPNEAVNIALDVNDNEKEVELSGSSDDQFVGLAFKLEEGRFGQLTYMRVYQGTLARGMVMKNVATGKKIKVPRLVRMHADEMEDVDSVGSGEICAMFGVDCNSGDTFTDTVNRESSFLPTMTTMYVPEPVVSLAIELAKKGERSPNFSKALQRFQREDPSFRVKVDDESKETIISGMGELHLEVYVERMKREYNVECKVGAPRVNYRETINKRATFDYTHKKQTGGAGQYGKVIGYIEPIPEDDIEGMKEGFVFENHMVGNSVPPEYVVAIEKGFRESLAKGIVVGQPVTGIRVCLTDGQAHAVDSSEIAFRAAAMGAFREAFKSADPQVLEPIMDVDVQVPDEYQGSVVGGLNRRRGVIQNAISRDGYCSITCQVPLSEMFGYSGEIRQLTQAKGEFSMEYNRHERVTQNIQKILAEEYRAEQEKKSKK